MDDAEFFLPSEIARLVYGHLKSTETNDVPNKFLSESPQLAECREFQKNNRTFKTEANGLPLKEILDQYLNLNKLILGTVNKLVGDSQKFRDPIEAFIFLLNGPKDKQLCNNGNTENQDSPKSYSSSSSEMMFSDFSLNLKSPEIPKRRKKNTKKKLSTVIELNTSVDRTIQETTPESNEIKSRPSAGFVPRQSTRLKLKNAAKNNRSCNSDSIKEMRKNPNDNCLTPCKVGKPPYTVNKIQVPKKNISLLSSDSEPEAAHEPELPILNYQSSTSRSVAERLNGLFSREQPEKRTVKILDGLFSPERPEKKTTLKVLKPRRAPLTQSSAEQSGDSEKAKCKRLKTTESTNSDNLTVENKKSKLPGGISSPVKASVSEEKASRSSDEFVPISNGPQTTERPKSKRKSDPTSTNNNSANSTEPNKSLPVIDGSVFKEKVINNKRLHEHLAASINEVIMNSPQKNLGDEIENLIDASMERITSNEMYDSLVHDLIADFNFAEDFMAGQTSSNTDPQIESRKNETSTPTFPSISNHTQLNTNTPVDIEDHLTNPNDDVESHANERNAIVIEIRGDQVLNEEPQVIEQVEDEDPERPSMVSEKFRQFFSTTPGIQASPKDKLTSVRNDSTSVINVISPDGELLESCEITNDNSERVVIHSNSVLYPINEHIPGSIVAIAKSSEYKICSLSGRNKPFVNIAPKPEVCQNSFENASDREKLLRKKRTRGGKRS